MAVTNEQILEFLKTPNLTDAQIATAMQQNGVTPAQLAQATGAPAQEVAVRFAQAVAPTITDYQGKEYDSGTVIKLAQQITAAIDPKNVKGGVFSTSGESVGFNYDEASKILGKPATAAEQVVLDMSRHLIKEGYTDLNDANATETNRRFGSTFTGGGGTIYELKKNADGTPVISTWSKDTSNRKEILGALALAAIAFGIPGVTEGLLSTAPAGATLGTTAITAAEAAGLGLTAAEAASLGLSATEFAAATAGTGLFSGGIGTGLEFAGSGGAFDLANAGIAGGAAEFTAAELAAISAGTYPAIGAGASALIPPTVVPPTGVPPVVSPTGVPPVIPPTGVPPVIPPTGIPPVIPPVVKSLIPTAVSGLLTPTNVGNLVTSGATTAAGLLQQQTSKEAAQRAQAMIDAETAAAKQAAQFRPIGMTTRFGTSQFQVDPVTGQLISAGYTLSPEAKNAQDRFITLAGQGLTQAEGAQQAFEPLQTGAQRLFGLGNQYLAQTPQDVAQNYLNQQMALLQPGRETELANLQNRLQQQGRGGLSVAQGGTMGATTPELQALYNARAQQEAQLAANAQQFGQQQVAFGAGLLGTGAQTMGQYYGGQQAAYAPYTTALGQVQALEQLGQQPLQMGAALGQQAAQAGANVGRLGLSGAEFSTRLATGPAATTNPYSTLLGGVGSSNAFGQVVGGLFGGVPSTTAMSAPATTFGTGNYYGNQDLGLFL